MLLYCLQPTGTYYKNMKIFEIWPPENEKKTIFLALF